MTPSTGVGPTRSWIHGGTAGPGGWAGVAEVAPDVIRAVDAIGVATAASAPRELVELARARMAMLLGAPAPPAPCVADRIDALAQWPTSPRFGARDRAVLALAEQFAIDVTGVTQGDVDRLLHHLSPDATVAVVAALWHAEGLLRLGLVLDVDPFAGERTEAGST